MKNGGDKLDGDVHDDAAGYGENGVFRPIIFWVDRRRLTVLEEAGLLAGQTTLALLVSS